MDRFLEDQLLKRLGLSISYQIVVEKHKGQLLVNSELGQGTEFIIDLPLRQSP